MPISPHRHQLHSVGSGGGRAITSSAPSHHEVRRAERSTHACVSSASRVVASFLNFALDTLGTGHGVATVCAISTPAPRARRRALPCFSSMALAATGAPPAIALRPAPSSGPRIARPDPRASVPAAAITGERTSRCSPPPGLCMPSTSSASASARSLTRGSCRPGASITSRTGASSARTLRRR